MMTVRLRYVPVLLRWWFRERRHPGTLVLGPEGQVEGPVSRLAFHCWPTDCDWVNRHMNNSRYLSFMDLGRTHLTLISGVLGELVRRRWFPVVVRIEIDYRRSVPMFAPFVMETRLVRVGTRSFTLSQRFLLGEDVAAEATVTAVVLGGGKSQEVAPLLGDRSAGCRSRARPQNGGEAYCGPYGEPPFEDVSREMRPLGGHLLQRASSPCYGSHT